MCDSRLTSQVCESRGNITVFRGHLNETSSVKDHVVEPDDEISTKDDCLALVNSSSLPGNLYIEKKNHMTMLLTFSSSRQR